MYLSRKIFFNIGKFLKFSCSRQCIQKLLEETQRNHCLGRRKVYWLYLASIRKSAWPGESLLCVYSKRCLNSALCFRFYRYMYLIYRTVFCVYPMPIIISWYPFCVHLQARMLNNAGMNLTNQRAREILEELVNLTKRSTTDESERPVGMLSGDLRRSVDVLALLAEYNAGPEGNGSLSDHSNQEKFLQVSSSLLEISNVKSWLQLEQVKCWVTTMRGRNVLDVLWWRGRRCLIFEGLMYMKLFDLVLRRKSWEPRFGGWVGSVSSQTLRHSWIPFEQSHAPPPPPPSSPLPRSSQFVINRTLVCHRTVG